MTWVGLGGSLRSLAAAALVRRASGELGVFGVDGSCAISEAFDRVLIGPAARGDARSAFRNADEGSL